MTVWWPQVSYGEGANLEIEYHPMSGMQTWHGNPRIPTQIDGLAKARPDPPGAYSSQFAIEKMFDNEAATCWHVRQGSAVM